MTITGGLFGKKGSPVFFARWPGAVACRVARPPKLEQRRRMRGNHVAAMAPWGEHVRITSRRIFGEAVI